MEDQDYGLHGCGAVLLAAIVVIGVLAMFAIMVLLAFRADMVLG